MKPQTENRYLKRIERAVELLAQRLADAPSSDELARAVNLSRYHFQRIYRAVTGETVLGTLYRLRALKALECLEAGQAVTVIAAEVGYDTPQAFSRAFRQWTGFSPSEARERIGDLRLRFRRPPQPDSAPAQVEIVSLVPLELAVLRTRRLAGPLNDVYETLFGAAEAQGRITDLRGIYGLPENHPDSEPDGVEVHIAGIALASGALEGFDTLSIGPGKAIRLRHVGPFETIESTAAPLYRHVVDQALTLSDQPPLFHHLDDPEEVPPEHLRTDLHLFLDDSPAREDA